MMGLETVFAGFPKPTLSDPEVVIGGPDPLEISQVISVSKEISIWTPLEKVGPPPN